MSEIIGQTDKVLNTGRIAYGFDGTNSKPIKANTAGEIIIGAGTANIGDVDINITKTYQTDLLATQQVAASTLVTSTALVIANAAVATFFIFHGRASSAAFGTNGTEYRIEGSANSSGNSTWASLATINAAATACLAVAASADVAAGGTTVVVTSGTSIPVAGDKLFWANTVAATASEWMTARAITGTASFTIVDALTNGQDSDTNIFTKAESWVVNMDVKGIARVRAVVNNNASGTTLAVYSRVACITGQ
ncbi:MAG: hypothetical protein WC648_05225 [Candidatus Paceibacterota bacterium]|jgi:hypothetical protein